MTTSDAARIVTLLVPPLAPEPAMALSLPRLRRPSPVPQHGAAAMHPGAALLIGVALRRRQWRIWIIVEALLLALVGFLALGGLVAALVSGAGMLGRLGPQLLSIAALIAVALASWNGWRRRLGLPIN